MATPKKLSRGKTGQKKQAKKSPSFKKIAKIVQKTSIKPLTKSPRVSKKSLEASEREQRSLAQVNLSILNAISAHIALVDANGGIVSVNEAWKRFATANKLKGANYSIGCNYITVCEQAHGDCAEEGRVVSDGLRAVLAGTQKSFAFEYPCHAPNEERWFRVMITPISETENVGAVVMHLNITESWRIEKALEKERRFVLNVLDATAAIVLVLDPECRIVQFNQVCEKLIGKTIEKMRGRLFRDLPILSGENAQERKSLLALLTGRTFPKKFENAWVDCDSQVYWIKWSNTVIKDKNGKIENYIATGIDITYRKKDEQKIHLLLKHNESILNSAWEGIYGVNGNGEATFFNRSAEQLTGWTASEVHGQVLHSLLHHSKPDGTPYPWKKCPVYFSLIRGGIHSVDNEVLWRKDGTNFSVEYTSMPVYNQDKKVQGAVVSFRDITARKESEKALRESEERFQAFMNFTPTVAFLKDDKGRYVYVNRQFQEKLHFSLAECLGKTDQQLFPPEVARMFIEHDRKVLGTKKVFEVEETTLDETGSVCYWWVMKFLIPRKTGSVLLGGVALDITARKKDQEALQQRELELQGSQKMLQALGGQLLSAQENERRRISRELHDDMNQRLAVLAFNIQSTQKGLDPSDLMYQNLQDLYEGISTLSDDVRRLAYQLHPSILDDLGLHVAMQSFVDDFTKYEGIPVDFSSTDVPVSVPQEIASCLYRVTQESLRNVARHAQCTQIEVKLLGVDGGLRLTIQDNGKGFEVEMRQLGRHGLGLMGMEERVRVVQGTYEVQSAPGQGTEITVWVPIPQEASR